MVSLKDVTVTLGSAKVLDRITLRVNRGEFVYIIGPSGAGKTSLLRSLYFDVKPDSGTVRVGQYNSAKMKNRQIPYLRRRLGIIFQDFKLLQERTVFQNVAFALRVTGTKPRSAKVRTIKALTSVGLLNKRDQYPENLSGGELQRVCIARAIVNEPAIVLADEPTGNLDPETGRDIFELLSKINSEGTAVLTATHNYNIIDEFPGRVIHIDKGRIVSQ